jgi:hypothetical protein
MVLAMKEVIRGTSVLIKRALGENNNSDIKNHYGCPAE